MARGSPTLCEDGTCCGTNHVFRVTWRPGDPRRKEAEQAIVLLAQYGQELFDSHLAYRPLNAHIWQVGYTVHKALEAVFGGHFKGNTAWEWLHTNGYVAWRPGDKHVPMRRRWFLTEKAIGWLDAIGFDWRTVGQWEPFYCGNELYEWLVGPLDPDDRYGRWREEAA